MMAYETGGIENLLAKRPNEEPQEIDHINGDPADNRPENLRAVSHQVNQQNQRRRADNSSGVTGVYWNKSANKWQAYIRTDGRMKYLGVFDSVDDAARVRKIAENTYGFHENHGRIA